MADPDVFDPSAFDPAAQDPSGPAPPSPWASVDLNNPGWGDDSIANKPVQFWGLDGLSPDLEKNLYNAMTAHSLGQDPATVDPGARPFMNLMGLMSSARADLGPGVFGDVLGGSEAQPTAQPASAPPANPQPAEPSLDVAPQQPVTPPDLNTTIPDTSVGPMSANPDVQALVKAQNLAMGKLEYQPGKAGAASHCNQATNDIVKATGVDTSPFGNNQGPYLANVQARNLANAANTPGSGWQAIDQSDAQRQANQGRTVVMAWEDPSGGHGHTVTVRPDLDGVASNPTMAQVGGWRKVGGKKVGNGQTNFHGAFGETKREAVKAYVYTGE